MNSRWLLIWPAAPETAMLIIFFHVDVSLGSSCEYSNTKRWTVCLRNSAPVEEERSVGSVEMVLSAHC